MKTTFYILLAAACLLSIPRELRSERWYASFSAGNTSSLNGSYEIENFYSPGWSYSLDFGFKLNPYVIVLPVSFSWGDYGFSTGNYLNNFWSNDDFIYEEKWNDAAKRQVDTYFPPVTDFQASSYYKDISFTPGIMLISPNHLGFKVFSRFGAGICSGKLTASNQRSWWDLDGDARITESSRESRYNRFAMLYGGGLEYNLFDKFGLLFEARCNVVYSGKKNANLKVEDEVLNLYGNPLLFYYMAPEGLRIHRFMEEKNLTTFDLRYGMSFRF